MIGGVARAQDRAEAEQDHVAQLESGLAEMVAEGLLPNAHAVILLAGQERVNVRMGMLDVERGQPLPEDAIFRLYSMTKPITSVAAMMLV